MVSDGQPYHVLSTLTVSMTKTLAFIPTQDGDIIAPELTPLKASWCNNNEGENSDEANPKERNKNLVNGQKKIKTQLFKKN